MTKSKSDKFDKINSSEKTQTHFLIPFNKTYGLRRAEEEQVGVGEKEKKEEKIKIKRKYDKE